MAVAVPNETPWEDEMESEGRYIERTPAQERARIERVRAMRSPSDYITRKNIVEKEANDNLQAQNDNEEAAEQEMLAQEQARVDRMRFARAQVIMASQEEGMNQVQKAEEDKPSILRYTPAGVVALFKDLLDYFFFLGSAPVVGTIITFICQIIMFIFLVFAKKNNSVTDMRFVIRRLLIVLVSFLIEGFIPGVNFFPFEIATVVTIYFLDRNLSEEQIRALTRIVHVLDKKPL
jgi:hypothetical protein